MNARDDPGYRGETVRLDGTATRPSYGALVDWVDALPDQKAVTYDFWARGNFTRRIIFNQDRDVSPLLVRVSSLGELRAAYRRVTLLGVPVDFVYSGLDVWTGMTLGLIPIDLAPDAGWGYDCAAGSRASVGGAEYAPILGHGNYLPEAVVSWLLTEGRKGFQSGRLMVAPAASVGIRPMKPDGRYAQLAGITGGVPLMDRIGAARIVLSLDLPCLDGFSSEQFDAFMATHRSEVRDFQSAFRDLTGPLRDGQENLDDVVTGLRNQVAEMEEVMRQGRFRIGMSGATATASLTTFALSIAQGLDPMAIGSSTSAAALALGDLYMQTRERRRAPPPHSLTLLWKLGVRNARAVARPPDQALGFGKEAEKPTRGFHWLCPPTPGMRIPTVRL